MREARELFFSPQQRQQATALAAMFSLGIAQQVINALAFSGEDSRQGQPKASSLFLQDSLKETQPHRALLQQDKTLPAYRDALRKTCH
jgi:hypothetical protein